MAAPSTASGTVGSLPADRLAERVSQLTRGWMRVGREEAKSLGLSLPQLFLLGGLLELGPIPVTRWVEETGISPSATTGLLDGLEAEGYVRRCHDAGDRRQVLVSLTPKGTRLAARLQTEFLQRWRAFCEGIPPDQLDAVTSVLDRVRLRMGTHEAAPCRLPFPVRTGGMPAEPAPPRRSRGRNGP